MGRFYQDPRGYIQELSSGGILTIPDRAATLSEAMGYNSLLRNRFEANKTQYPDQEHPAVPMRAGDAIRMITIGETDTVRIPGVNPEGYILTYTERRRTNPDPDKKADISLVSDMLVPVKVGEKAFAYVIFEQVKGQDSQGKKIDEQRIFHVDQGFLLLHQ